MVLEYAAAAGVSGFCAAVAAAAAKLATGDGHQMVQLSPEAAHSETLTVWVRGAFFALHLAANIAMWLLFTRALAAAPSSLEPTAINTAGSAPTTFPRLHALCGILTLLQCLLACCDRLIDVTLAQ